VCVCVSDTSIKMVRIVLKLRPCALNTLPPLLSRERYRGREEGGGREGGREGGKGGTLSL
jgi:hypothetical protein